MIIIIIISSYTFRLRIKWLPNGFSSFLFFPLVFVLYCAGYTPPAHTIFLSGLLDGVPSLPLRAPSVTFYAPVTMGEGLLWGANCLTHVQLCFSFF